MTFHDIEFSRAISYRSQVGEEGSALVVELESRAEQRVDRDGQTRIVCNLAYGVKTPAQLALALDFKRCRGHRAHTWRLLNVFDYSTNAANTFSNFATDLSTAIDEELGVGDGSTTQFQLVKRFVSGAQTSMVNIEKPIAGTVKVAIDGVVQSSGFSVNTSTGVVTFTTAPTNGEVVSAGCLYNYEARFANDLVTASVSSFRIGDIVGGLEVVSVFGSSIIDDDIYRGGGSTISLTADTELTPQHGRVVRVTPDASGRALILPDPTRWALGGPYWKLRNTSGSYTFMIDHAGSTLATIATSAHCEVWLADAGGGVPVWEVFA